MSVRDDPVLFLQQGQGKVTGGSSAGGGSAITTTHVHRLNGPEHTLATDDDRLNATGGEPGLMPKLSGISTDVLDGTGTFRPETSGGAVTVQDEGTPLATSADTINFVGAGVAATGTGSTKTVTVSEPDADAHIADTTDAHDASAISIADAGSYFTGTDVEAALQELGADVAAIPATSAGGGFDVTPPQSIPMPPWVKPTGSGVITADAQGRLTIDSGSTYKGFPGMAFLEGRLHLVYRDGSAHDSNDGVIKYRTSDDLGRTWSSATTILTGAAGHDLRDPSIVALSTGRLLVGYDDGIYPAAPLAVRVIHSDNRGQSWSSAYVVPVTGMSGECAGTSQMIELRDGTVLLPAFGNNGGNSFCVLFKSTDGGLTFPTQITVATSGSRHYQELQIRVLASGKIVGLMRSDTNAHTWRTVSTDAGATWSAPSDVLTASARPDFVEFFPGALLFFGRSDNTNFYARWAVSWDEGATWTALQNVDGSTDVWEYGAPVVLAPGYVAVAYSIHNSSSDADLYLRYYHDGYGMDPLGNLTVLSGGGSSFATPSIVLGSSAANGAASTVIRSDATIAAFDATAPVTQAFSDTAATGSAAFAARRDHRHGMPAASGTSASDAYIWRPLMDGAGNVITDGTGQAVMAYSAA